MAKNLVSRRQYLNKAYYILKWERTMFRAAPPHDRPSSAQSSPVLKAAAMKNIPNIPTSRT